MKKDSVIAILATFCLITTLFVVSSSLGYDPWADINDDGKIDMKDIGYEARLFGTSGDPAKPVAIEGYNWTVPSYSVDIPAGQMESVHVVTAGYKQVTLGLDANVSGLYAGEVQAVTGFLLGDRYVGVDSFNVSVEGDGNPHAGDVMWIEPSVRVIPAIVGYKFNLTVWLNLTESSFSWQFTMYFSNSTFKPLNIGYTAGSSSEFFEGLLTTPLTPLIGDDYVCHRETLVLHGDYRSPGYGARVQIHADCHFSSISSIAATVHPAAFSVT